MAKREYSDKRFVCLESDLHTKLKARAEADERSIVGLIRYMYRYMYEPDTLPTPPPPPQLRTPFSLDAQPKKKK